MNIAMLCLNGLQNFIKPIETHLSKSHTVTTCFSNDQAQITKAVSDADVVWIEWANELAIQLTHSDLLDGKKVILRCHSYEVLSGYIPKINWDKISEVIFVAKHVQDLALQQAKIKNYQIIPNPLDVKEWEFVERENGKNLAFVADINAKKGIMLLIHAFNALVKKDPSYMLHIAGRIQDPRFGLYIKHIIKKLEIEKSVSYHGYIENIQEWLKDKNYAVCTSPWESQGMGLCESMAMGIKPVIHNFVGAENIYKPEYLWTSIDDFLAMIEGEYNSKDYRNYVATNFAPDRIFKRIDKIIKNIKPVAKLEDGVTAIIAVHNGAKAVGRSIGSLLAQTVKPKVIVVDDASTDDTCEVVKKYDVELIKLKENKWVASARNEALKRVKTKYVMFLDADDSVTEDYIEETMNTLEEHPECGFAYTDMCHVTDGDEKFVVVPPFNMNGFINHNYVSYCALMRTEDVHYSDYLNDCRNHMYDHELFLRIAMNKPGIKSDGGRFDYTIASDSVSKNYERGRTDMYLQMLDGVQGIDVKADPGNKILLVCWGRDYLDASKVSFEVYTFLKSLEEFGEVFTFYWDIEMKYFGREGMINRLLAWIDKVDPTHIFHVCYKDHIPVEVWKKISEKHSTIGWFCDDNWRYDDYSKEYSKGFRHIVTTYEEVYTKYLKEGES
jgi:glycosyltransferase involved in cell wall biosynthesis